MRRVTKLVSAVGSTAIVMLLAAGSAGAGPAPLYGWRGDYRHDDYRGRHEESRGSVRVDVNGGGYEWERRPEVVTRATRVWVEPVYRNVIQRVWVEPVYRDITHRVWVEPVMKCMTERVWVNSCWETRTITRYDCGRPYTKREQVYVPGHYEERSREVVVTPGHYKDVCRRELVCAGHYEDVTRQELVSAGHWEERCEEVVVATPRRIEPGVRFDLRIPFGR
jgi:hypothetical protein